MTTPTLPKDALRLARDHQLPRGGLWPLGLAATVSLLQGSGAALEKKGIEEIVATMGEDHLTVGLMTGRLGDLLLVALTTPTFVVGVLLVLVVGGVLLNVLLSMGDAAKVVILTGALTPGCYVVANALLNGETFAGIHLVGIAIAALGCLLLSAAGIRRPAGRDARA